MNVEQHYPTETVRCTIQVLSPVHVGNGVKLKKGLDFYTDGGQTVVVPEHQLSEHLCNNPRDIDVFMSDNETKRTEVLKRVQGKRTFAVNCEAKDLLQHQRDGMGQPYIPGSSIKGALRTILLNTTLQTIPQHQRINLLQQAQGRSEWASDNLLKKIFGNDPNHNLLRVLSVTDAHFTNNDLEIERIGILNLTNQEGTRYGWKNVPGRDTVESINNATSIYAETLKQDSSAQCFLRFDNFLLRNEPAKQELQFSELRSDKLFQDVNHYSRNRIQKDIRFFERLGGTELETLLNDIDFILSKIPEPGTEDEQKRMLFRMAWGTGWQNMTGDWLNEHELSQMRQQFRLGKGHAIFPKTRKVVFDGTNPLTVTGWVEIKRE